MEELTELEKERCEKFMNKEKGSTDVINYFALEFEQSFCYAFFLQIILVTYMYVSVGHGKYWKVLFYGSVLGFFGAVMEHVFQAYQNTLPYDKKYESKASIFLFVAEIGWITSEFAVPVLNLIKLNSLAHIKIIKYLNILTSALFCAFTFFRIEIGYSRYKEGRVDCKNCNTYHSFAFGVMAITDTILSIILYIRINKTSHSYKSKQGNDNISLLSTFKKSSVFTLLIIDVISVFLSLTYIFSITKDYAKPLHALKNNFLLILAVDAFIFKFNANYGSTSYFKSYGSQGSGNHSTVKFTAKPKVINSTFQISNKPSYSSISKPTNTMSPSCSFASMPKPAHSPVSNINMSTFSYSYQNNSMPNILRNSMTGNSSILQNYKPPPINLNNKQFSLYNTSDTQLNVDTEDSIEPQRSVNSFGNEQNLYSSKGSSLVHTNTNSTHTNTNTNNNINSYSYNE